MSDQVVDDKIVQRLLFVSSDLIGNEITNYGQNLDRHKIIKLNASKEGKALLGQEQQIEVLRRQQELFSDSVVPTGKAAWELFRDNQSSVPIDLTYTITNNVLLYFDTTPWFFDIDQVNSSNKKIYISKLHIKNRSKDAFTLKSNYLLTLKIHFTTFDDLLEKNIVVKNALDPSQTSTIAPMHLLYKFFDQTKGSQNDKHLQDSTGMFLNQTLIVDRKYDRYTDLVNKLETNIFSKNYHLTYHKHTIDMFKGEDPIFKYFENELTLEYIAYEADGVDKPMTPEMKKIIPKVNSNLYRLLDKGVLDDSMISQTNYLGGQRKDEKTGKVLESNVIFTLQDLFKKLEENNNAIEVWTNQLNCEPDTIAGSQREGIQNSLKNVQENNLYLKTYANRILIFTILRICQVYRIKLPYRLIGIYERGNFMELFLNNFSMAGLLSTLATDVGLMFATGGASAIKTVGSFASYALISGVEAYFASKEVVSSKPDLVKIRDAVSKVVSNGLTVNDGFNSAKFTIENKDKYLNLALGIDSKGTNKFDRDRGSVSAADTDITRSDFKTLNGTSEESKQKIKQMLERMGTIELAQFSDDRDAVIFFTTFGEIMKILKILDPSESLRIISGGYLMNIDSVTAEAAYVNFASLPITINSLSRFLYNVIENTDRSLNYDSELFFRDCYENLVKAVLNDGQTILPSIQNSAPRNIKVISTIHKEQQNETQRWFKDTNLLLEPEFNNLKYNFLKTKNFNLAQGGMNQNSKITKIYVIGTYDEIKYYDFFKAYNKWSTRYKKPNTNLYNCDQFQEFINREHLMPCLLMKNASDSESILKKKYVQFSRIDNPNLNTGNFINKKGQIRYPYQFTADFKILTAFFMDIGSLIFVAPPSSRAETALYGQINMFGFGGMYIIKSADMEYMFQRIQDGKLTIPNLESKCTFEAVMLTHGDSIRNLQEDIAKEGSKPEWCGGPKPVSNEPSSTQSANQAIGAKGLLIP